MKHPVSKRLYALKLLGIDYIPISKKICFQEQKPISQSSPCANCDYITGKKQIPKCDKKIIILGEFPNESYDEISCFAKEETELIKKMLEAIKIKMEDVYATTAIKCCEKNYDPQKCKNILMSELSSFSSEAKYILCFGALNSIFFLENEMEIEKIRNKVFKFGDLRVVFTIKPDKILKESGVKQKELKKMAWNDLKLFQKIISDGERS